MHIAHHAFHLLAEILPVFLLAVVASSLIDKFLPDDFLDKFAKDASFLNLLNFSFIGSLIPICTCGMIPLAIKLHGKGLNWKLLTAFLVAGNACSIPALILTSTLGYKITLVRFISSIVFGLLVTYIIIALVPKDFKLELNRGDCCHSDHDHCCDNKSLYKKIFEDIVSMCKSFLPWILLAVLIASVLSSLTNGISLAQSIGSTGKFISPLIASVIAFPFYFCAGADIPISHELIKLGLPLGTIISFMLASPGVNLTSFIIYRKAIGFKKALVLSLVSIISSSLIGIILLWSL